MMRGPYDDTLHGSLEQEIATIMSRTHFTVPLFVSLFALTIAAAHTDPSTQGYYRYPSLRGDTIVFTAQGDLWKVGVKGGAAQQLTTHPGEETHPAISTDGRTVAFSAT